MNRNLAWPASLSQLGSLNDALSGKRPADFRPINGSDGRPAAITMPQHWYQSNPSVILTERPEQKHYNGSSWTKLPKR